MKKSNEKFKSDIREIIENYVNGYFAVDWDTGDIDKELSRHIEERWFDKLEKDINNYIKEIINIMAVFMRCIAMVLIVGMILIAIFA